MGGFKTFTNVVSRVARIKRKSRMTPIKLMRTSNVEYDCKKIQVTAGTFKKLVKRDEAVRSIELKNHTKLMSLPNNVGNGDTIREEIIVMIPELKKAKIHRFPFIFC